MDVEEVQLAVYSPSALPAPHRTAVCLLNDSRHPWLRSTRRCGNFADSRHLALATDGSIVMAHPLLVSAARVLRHGHEPSGGRLRLGLVRTAAPAPRGRTRSSWRPAALRAQRPMPGRWAQRATTGRPGGALPGTGGTCGTTSCTHAATSGSSAPGFVLTRGFLTRVGTRGYVMDLSTLGTSPPTGTTVASPRLRPAGTFRGRRLPAQRRTVRHVLGL